MTKQLLAKFIQAYRAGAIDGWFALDGGSGFGLLAKNGKHRYATLDNIEQVLHEMIPKEKKPKEKS